MKAVNIHNEISLVAERLQLPLLAGSCLAGFLGEAIYSPYDITGELKLV